MPATETQIKDTIFHLLSNIAPEADLNQLKGDEEIRETLGIDSYDFLNFMIGLNDAYGVEIPETDYGKLNTLNEIITYLTPRIR